MPYTERTVADCSFCWFSWFRMSRGLDDSRGASRRVLLLLSVRFAPKLGQSITACIARPRTVFIDRVIGVQSSRIPRLVFEGGIAVFRQHEKQCPIPGFDTLGGADYGSIGACAK